MNSRLLKYLIFFTLFEGENCLANLSEIGQDFGVKLLERQNNVSNDKEFNERLNALPGFQSYQQGGKSEEDKQNVQYLKAMEGHFSANIDRGEKNTDIVKSEVSKLNAQKLNNAVHSTSPSLNQAEALLKQKHRWHIHANDPLLYVYDKISGEEKAIKQGYDIPDLRTKTQAEDQILTCREGAIGHTQTCTKRLMVRAIPQPDIVKQITAHFTARCYNLVTFSINLATGNIAVSQCENPGSMKLNVDNPIGANVDLSKVSIECVAKQHIGEVGVDFRAQAMNPSPANGFTAIFTAFQPNTGRKNKHEGNKNNVRGGQYIWKVTIPQDPILATHWEGCEDLERKTGDSFCELVENQQKGINEARSINGFPTLVTQPYWEEDKLYLCGQGSNKNECETLKKQACEQIASKCSVQKNETCIEYEQTYRCPAHKYKNNNGLLDQGTEIKFLQGHGECERKEAFEASDFGEAITYWSALKEINNPMKDGLEGIKGDPNNPSIFHGKCQRCTVKLGSFFQDCCKLKGIAMGLLGGCKGGEKELANAAVKDKRCYKVSDLYCSRKVLGTCVEKKEAYCCYGSQIAKIVQEIAHHQLNISWGTGEEPNCVSLTADQLSRLDFDTPFAREKLSVLIGEIQATAEEKFNKVQENITGKGDITDRVDTLQKKLNNHFSQNRPQRTERSTSPQDLKREDNR
jgi:hypothetical protein